MSSPNINVLLQGILTASDVTQSPAPYVTNIDFQNPTLNGTKFYYDSFFQVSTGGNTIPIGGGGGGVDAYLILVINRSLTNNLQVDVTVTAGPSGEAAVLGPGGVFLVMDPSEAGPGWSTLFLMAIGATVPATIFTAI